MGQGVSAMAYQHAVVWIDHREARVIDFSVDDRHVVTIPHEGVPRKLHRKANPDDGSKPDVPEDPKYFDEVVAAIGDAREILVTGPGTAKTAFRKHIDKRHPKVAERIVGVEATDHPSDGQLLSMAKRYFKRVDNLRGL